MARHTPSTVRRQVYNLLQGGRILPLLFQCLEDDYFEATRLAACSALAALGPWLGRVPEQVWQFVLVLNQESCPMLTYQKLAALHFALRP